MYGRELGILKEREEGKQNDQNAPFAGVPRVDRVGHTWTEGLCPRVAHVVLTWPPSKGLLAISSLARTLGSSARILGVRTPISNPFSDYEP
jgi:hypothetical protein